MNIRCLSYANNDFDQQIDNLCLSGGASDPEVVRTVGGILERVRADGDKAVLDYTRQFDGSDAKDIKDLRIPHDTMQTALESLDAGLREALEFARGRIRAYAERQALGGWTIDEQGIDAGVRITPLDSVGIYVPGGGASYPSSVLMNAIPAQVAGVERIVAVVPLREGAINQVVLATIALCGIDEVWTIGGAQAIGALAYGTASIEPVVKIVGPGNAYVAEAKKQVFGHIGIDTIAGPSEIVIISDGSGDASWIAADLLAQAEHDADARAILLCTDEDYIGSVKSKMEALLQDQPRQEVIVKALEKNGALLNVKSIEQAIEISNKIAPEHLGLSLTDAEKWLPQVRNAGAIFVGSNASEVLGDYCAGPNHVLPTAGAARFSSPLGVYTFQKRSSVVSCSPEMAAKLGKVASRIASAEGLHAHARAASLRASS